MLHCPTEKGEAQLMFEDKTRATIKAMLGQSSSFG